MKIFICRNNLIIYSKVNDGIIILSEINKIYTGVVFEYPVRHYQPALTLNEKLYKLIYRDPRIRGIIKLNHEVHDFSSLAGWWVVDGEGRQQSS